MTLTVGTWIKPEKANPYDDDMPALVAETDADPTIAATLTVDVEHASREELLFRKSANAHKRTARLVNRDDSKLKVVGVDEDGNDVLAGNVALTFQLVPQHKPRRGKTLAAEDMVE